MLHKVAPFTIRISRFVEIFDIPGRNGSFLSAMPGTRRLFGWITEEYLGIGDFIRDIKNSLIWSSKYRKLLTKIETDLSWLVQLDYFGSS